jgi:hypothetical protein
MRTRLSVAGVSGTSAEFAAERASGIWPMRDTANKRIRLSIAARWMGQDLFIFSGTIFNQAWSISLQVIPSKKQDSAQSRLSFFQLGQKVFGNPT